MRETRPRVGQAGSLSARSKLIAAANEGTPGVSQPSATDLDSTCDRIGCSNPGTLLRQLELFRMAIQQDPSEPDPWWGSRLSSMQMPLCLRHLFWPELDPDLFIGND